MAGAWALSTHYRTTGIRLSPLLWSPSDHHLKKARMGVEIRGVELSENSINSLLIDDILSHQILIMRWPCWDILRINCVISSLIVVGLTAACNSLLLLAIGGVLLRFRLRQRADVFYKSESARPIQQAQIGNRLAINCLILSEKSRFPRLNSIFRSYVMSQLTQAPNP